MKPNADSLVILAVDEEAPSGPRRVYKAGKGGAPFKEWVPGEGFPVSGTNGRALVFVWPTKTYSEGMGSSAPAELSPEDRAMFRAAKKRHGGEMLFFKVGGKAASGAEQTGPAPRFVFDSAYLRDIKRLFKESMTRPNRQDYTWLATKTFTFNLAIRLFFVLKAVNAGELPAVRAVISTSWYQVQDAVFTVFGQTYMKFLGRMTGMVRAFNAQVGDMVFVYFQLCGFEFLNRLVLGPLGENPLVMTPKGLALVFLNILQGM
ncbi:MAG: hypothetical protein HYV15_01325, partial [Elusimicrobia bacterium]|nr:hypothetical protein [Elusimicrobiota bacterium]